MQRLSTTRQHHHHHHYHHSSNFGIADFVTKSLEYYYMPPWRWIRQTMKHPLVLYTISWTLLLAACVTIISITLELGFSSFLHRSQKWSSSATAVPICGSSCTYCFTLPLDHPSDNPCVRADFLGRSAMDFIVPPIFAGIVVAASACFVHNLGIWNDI